MTKTNAFNRITHNIAATENKGNEDRFGAKDLIVYRPAQKVANLRFIEKSSNAESVG
jgi:glutamate formiminotransferase